MRHASMMCHLKNVNSDLFRSICCHLFLVVTVGWLSWLVDPSAQSPTGIVKTDTWMLNENDRKQPVFTCNETQSDCPPKIENGFICGQKYTTSTSDPHIRIAEIIAYCCQHSYIMIGSFEVHKSTRYKWSSQNAPRCVLPPEIPPPVIENGHVCNNSTEKRLDNYDVLYSVTYCCDDDSRFQLIAPMSNQTIWRKSKADWPLPPQCPPKLANGNICNFTKTNATSPLGNYTVTYCCNPDASLIGNPQITKAGNEGRWSEIPHCFNSSQLFSSTISSDIDLPEWEMLEKRMDLLHLLSSIIPLQNDTLLTLATRQNRSDRVDHLIRLGASVLVVNQAHESALIIAARNDQVSIAASLLAQSNANINDIDQSLGNYTALLIAAKFASPEMVRILLSYQADLEARTNDGKTALMLAAIRGEAEISSLLIDAKIKTDIEDSLGNTALIYAANNGNLETVRVLVENGTADVNLANSINEQTPLYVSASGGLTEIAEYLLEHGADINAKDVDGWTALMAASYKGHLNTTKLLLSLNADFDATTANEARSALSLAVQQGHGEVVKTLTEAGAGLDLADSNGTTPLMYAVKHDHFEVFSLLLLEKGANVAAKDLEINSVLMHVARMDNRSRYAKLLLDESLGNNPIDVNDRNVNDETALIVAIKSGSLEVATFLASLSKTNINAQDRDGMSALMWASAKGYASLARQLVVERHADVTQKTEHQGRTALILASLNKNGTDIVSMLVEAGANLEVRDTLGWNAFIAAVDGGSLATVEFLIEKYEERDLNPVDNDGNTTLMHAITEDDRLDLVQLLLNRTLVDINAKNRFEVTAIVKTAKHGLIDVLDILYARGAFTGGIFEAALRCNQTAVIEKIFSFGIDEIRLHDMNKALLVASQYGHAMAVGTLLERGALVNAVDATLMTPLQNAAKEGHAEVVTRLLAKNANLLHVNQQNETALILAVKGRHEKIGLVLIEKGSDLDAVDSSGRNALLWAVMFGLRRTVEELTKRGVDLNKSSDKSGNTALMYAVANTSLDLVTFLLDSRIDINATNNENDTALIYASRFNDDVNIVKLLINRGVTTTGRNNRTGETALIAAVANDHCDIVDFLLQNKISSVDEVDDDGNSAYSIAARRTNDICLEQIYLHGPDYGSTNSDKNTTLMQLAYDGNLRMMKIIFRQYSGDNGESAATNYAIDARNANGDCAIGLAALRANYDVCAFLVDQDADIASSNHNGDTPLLLAASNGRNRAVVDLLIRKGAYIHTKNSKGDTALIVAASVGDLDVVKVLVLKDADVQAANIRGESAVIAAARNGHLDCLKFLLSKGGDLEDKTKDGETPLIAASMNGHIDIVRYLLIKAGVDTKPTTVGAGDTALMVAARSGYVEIVRLLHEHGSAVNAANKTGSTALIYAIENRHQRLTFYLLDNGALVNKQDIESGKSPLLIGASHGHLELVHALVTEHGANVNMTDRRGRTPMMDAAFNGHTEVVKFLIENKADMVARDYESVSALVLASWNDHTEIVKFMIDNGAPRAGCPLCFFNM